VSNNKSVIAPRVRRRKHAAAQTLTSSHEGGQGQHRAAPRFLVRLVGKTKAECLFNGGTIHYRHD
jgi:hypothetical protein